MQTQMKFSGRLADLEAKHAAATSGDWSAHKDGGVFSTSKVDGLPESLLLRCEQKDVAENAAFIAAMHNELPNLLKMAKLAAEMQYYMRCQDIGEHLSASYDALEGE